MAVKVDLGEDEEVKADMTPMIDVIFLLLVFFLLTTKFVKEELVINNLLPTDKGQAASPSQEVKEQREVNILIYPNNHTPSMGVEDNDNLWKDVRNMRYVIMRINNEDYIEVDGELLSGTGERPAELDKIHGYIHDKLNTFENNGPRADEDPVIIHCFSGLPWKYALAVYDSVRDYEGDKAREQGLDPDDLANAREVTFSPPRIREYHTWELGNELFEIMHTSSR